MPLPRHLGLTRAKKRRGSKLEAGNSKALRERFGLHSHCLASNVPSCETNRDAFWHRSVSVVYVGLGVVGGVVVVVCGV